jgi:ribosomal protein S18 acetylase RimI-like enzyme
VLGVEDVGHRVVVRWIVGIRGDRPTFTDALGVLLAATETHLTVRTTAGPAEIARTDIVAMKRVPDQRRRSFTERLETVAALGWSAPVQDRLGDWLLRAADGWSMRGNSALPIGDPGMPVPLAVDAVTAWYTARGLRPAITVPLPLGGRLFPDLDRRGWTARPPTIVQIAPLTAFAAEEPSIRVDPGPSEAWLAAAAAQKGPLPAAARSILSAGPGLRYASGYRAGGELVAWGRAAVFEGWLGLSVIGVHPDHRRRGWAARICRALGADAARLDATQAYLQVEEHNVGAVACYEQLGFATTHAYVTRLAPPA